MKMISIIIQSFIISSILLIVGCSNTERALRTDEYRDCTTIVQGFLHSGGSWIGKPPKITGSAIRVQEQPNATPKTFRGEILRVDDKGILFKEKRESLLYEPDSSFYSFDQIIWAIDNDGKVIHGERPKGLKKVSWSMNFELSNVSQTNSKKITMQLEPNQPFSYCLKPGSYLITKITYYADAGWGEECEDVSEFLPSIKMNVDPFVTNYIGDLYLDLNDDTTQEVHCFSTKIIKRPGSSAAGSFGLIGALAYMSTIESPPTHTLYVKDKSETITPIQTGRKISILSIQDTSPNYMKK